MSRIPRSSDFDACDSYRLSLSFIIIVIESRALDIALFTSWRHVAQFCASWTQTNSQRGEGRSTLKLNAFVHYYNVRSRLICTKICFFSKQKISLDVWGAMASTAPWIRHWNQSCYRRFSEVRGIFIRGVRVYPYPRVYPCPTRTRGYGSGTGRCLTGRVGYGYEVHGYGYTRFYP